MLPNYRNILYATDLTINSEYAFKHAVMLARTSQAKIYMLHVIPEIDAGFRTYVSTIMGQGMLESFEEKQEEEARKDLTARLEQFIQNELADRPEDLKNIASIEVVHGHAVEKILMTADKMDADVIIMGTHGKGAITRAFLGSVAEQVLHKSKRPVFVIPIPD